MRRLRRGALQSAQHGVQKSAARYGIVCRIAILSTRRGAVAGGDAGGFATGSGVYSRWLRSAWPVGLSSELEDKQHHEHCLDT